MIEKTTSFKTSDGTLHPTIEAAQHSEMMEFLKNSDIDEAQIKLVADKLILDKAVAIDILTMKATSKPRARKVNGGTKKRAVKITNQEPVPA